MSRSILYLGDDDLTAAAGYLGGVLTHYGMDFDHVPSDVELPDEAASGRKLMIVSDYPAANFRQGQLHRIAEKTAEGMGLLMIGGWESFAGRDVQYTHTPLAEALCVTMSDSDDRVNCPQPCLVEKTAEHPILANLPFDAPPGVGGYNRVAAKPEATTLLLARRYAVRAKGGQYLFHPGGADPLLVVGSCGRGRVAAFTSDVAPHWVGGLVDWGDRRIKAQARGGSPIEVGRWYAELLVNLVRWTASPEPG